MKAYFIEPFDTLFFRDGRPFEIGGEASLKIPPSPSTFYGAIRSSILANVEKGFQKFDRASDEKLTRVVGKKGDSEGITASLSIAGPFFAFTSENKTEILFPRPMDLLEFENRTDNGTNVVKVKIPVGLELYELDNSIETNSTYRTYAINPFAEMIETQKGFILPKLLQKYLDGSTTFEEEDKELILDYDDIFLSDYREGNALHLKNKNVEQGRLFTIQHIQFKQNVGQKEKIFGFFIIVNGDEELLPNEMILRLGGDGKTAYMRNVLVPEILDEQKIMNQITKTRLFKLYLATPAIFEMGWKSRFMHNGYLDNYPGLKFELIGACLDRMEMFGGYDVVANVPKLSFPAVQAGSVYYFRLVEGSAEDVIKIFHKQNISDFRKNQGFGYTFVGGIKNV